MGQLPVGCCMEVRVARKAEESTEVSTPNLILSNNYEENRWDAFRILQ